MQTQKNKMEKNILDIPEPVIKLMKKQLEENLEMATIDLLKEAEDRIRREYDKLINVWATKLALGLKDKYKLVHKK